MKFLNLADTFDIDLNDYSFGDIQTPPLPGTPQPVVNATPNTQNVDPNTNLTRVETSVIITGRTSNSEKKQHNGEKIGITKN